jgi:hypothetical protein
VGVSTSDGSEPGSASAVGGDGPRRPLRLFAGNRRDGARLLSSTLVLAVIGLVGWQSWIGRLVGVSAGLLCLFWWLQYRQLRQ